MKVKFKVLLIVLVIISVGVYVAFQFAKPKSINDTLSPVTSVAPTQIAISLSPDRGGVWNVYVSDLYGFSIEYPLDVNHQTIQEGERFYKLGPTQSTGTEFFDGLSVVVKAGSLEGESFSEWVDRKYKSLESESFEPRMGAKENVTIAGKQGISFRVSSLGESTYIYLPKGDNEYLEIIDSTVEPQNREPLFKDIIKGMLDSIQY